MTSDFLFLYEQLNFNSFTQEKKEKIACTTGLLEIEAFKIFECGKNNDGY